MKAGVYRHFKGGLYLYLGEGQHTGTNERLAIYISLDATLPGPRIRARPYYEFNQLVKNPKYTEQMSAAASILVPRFEWVGDKE